MKIQQIIIPIILMSLLTAAEKDFKGQLSLRGSGWNSNNVWYGGMGVQYIPNLQISKQISPASLVDFEASVYGYINKEAGVASDDFRPYRFNLRYATQQSETQLGLQKINFGPAQLLRSLMWFDRQNPTDPLNFAEGVWGLRYRYGFLNNANLWLWGLYGNAEPKGLETYGSDESKPEFGGRVQLPVPMGEFAVTAHHRNLCPPVRFDEYSDNDITRKETRLALDGRWDVVVGAWFEAVVADHFSSGFHRYTKMLTLGTDYTFGIGNGLYVLAEHMINQLGNELMSSEQDAQLSACMLNYPLGMFDNLSLMAFYSWETDDFIQYASWQRAYDKIVINLALFHFPDTQFSIINTVSGGYGAQLMLIYNH
ncbi:MAG: hypothetical protein Q7J65_01630 [Candidatus Marinimicrobia bacterium]|nr:hypothetical protein [Candidatus Neomarinimicrobiota bacterium]